MQNDSRIKVTLDIVFKGNVVQRKMLDTLDWKEAMEFIANESLYKYTEDEDGYCHTNITIEGEPI